MSGPPPEIGQARVRAQLAAEGKLPEQQFDDRPEQVMNADIINEEPIPQSTVVDPIVEALQTLPDQDLIKLAQSYKIRVSGGRNALIKALASLGLGPAHLPE